VAAWPRVTGNQYKENVMSSEMLLADKYLSIINDIVEVSGEPVAVKAARRVRREAVGNTGYAVR
jgi:hypothetical protein